jgi:hypothetical protein
MRFMEKILEQIGGEDIFLGGRGPKKMYPLLHRPAPKKIPGGKIGRNFLFLAG